MPQCMGNCKTGKRCKNPVRKGKKTCRIKTHIIGEENSVSNEVLKTTHLLKDLTNIIGTYVPHYPTTAYLIGGIDSNSKLYAVPFSIDSITMDTPPFSLSYHSEDNNNNQEWGGSNATSCVLDEIIYVFGGTNDSDTREISSRKVATYDPLSDTWDTTTIPMIPGHCGAGCSPVVIGSNIYVVGAYDKDQSMYILDTRSLTWSKIQVNKNTPPRLLHSSTICSIDKVIYAIGSDSKVHSFDTEATTPIWEVFAKIDLHGFPRRTIAIKNKMYLFGDSKLHVFDIENKNCTELSWTHDAFFSHPFLLDDERYIYIVTRGRTKIVTYDIENDRWLLDDVVDIPRNNYYERYQFSVVTLPGSSQVLVLE
jgi:hypothetical protein